MFIEIDNTRTLHELQTEFHQYYPFLKLEFFSQPHEWTERSPVKEAISPFYTIGGLGLHNKPGLMDVSPTRLTGDIEQLFKRKFNLNAQVYRRHGHQWIETAETDELALQVQNEIGRINTKTTLAAQQVLVTVN